MQCKTQTAFAEALGVTKGTLSKYLRRDDWPVRRTRPWGSADVEKARQWRLGLQDDRSDKAKPPMPNGAALAEQKQRAVTLREAHRARREKVAADLAEKSVIKVEIFEGAVAGLARLFRQTLDELVASLPHQLDGDVVKNSDVLKKWRREACERLIAQQELEVAEAEKAT